MAGTGTGTGTNAGRGDGARALRLAAWAAVWVHLAARVLRLAGLG
jgi:hypothetical protein